MSASNFTPIAGKDSSKKKSSSKLKIIRSISLFVMIVGVGVGYVMVQRGFNFRPKATTYSRNLVKNGWNGTCFTNTSAFKYGARYQCPGKIDLYGSGCQEGSVSKRTGNWQYNSVQNPLTTNGQSNVCIVPDGNDGPKDSKGCFTQQLDVDDGSTGSPEGFYSFDSCGSPVPADPKPPAVTPTIPPSITPTMPPSITPSITPTLPPFITPTIPPSITPTRPPSITPTPTPPFCVDPGTPANVHINCPLCDQANSQ